MKMAEKVEQGQLPRIPQEHMQKIRELVHDLNNALEIIVQTNYLLGMGELDESAKQWLAMMDTGVRQATGIGKELRDYVRLHGADGTE
jgi:light-regulated signal transduction histidine kinase (bacteriophytochrome)